jgi:carboxymethylenebutenolidase
MNDESLPETVSWVQSSGLSRRQAVVAGGVASGFALAAQPVMADMIITPPTGLEEGMISFKSGDTVMPAYRAKPSGKQNLPVVIVVQEIFGLHAWVKDVVRRFARAGYLAIAPDYYVRQGDATKVADIKILVETIVSKVSDAQVMADTDAAIAHASKDGYHWFLLGWASHLALCCAQSQTQSGRCLVWPIGQFVWPAIASAAAT